MLLGDNVITRQPGNVTLLSAVNGSISPCSHAAVSTPQFHHKPVDLFNRFWTAVVWFDTFLFLILFKDRICEVAVLRENIKI